MDDAKTAYTTTTTNEPPPPPKAAKKTAPEPQQASGRTLRASTVAKSAAALAKLVSPPPPPPRRRAPKLDSTKETVESAADAAKPKSLLQQAKLPVVTHRSRTKTGWVRGAGKGKEEKEAIRFVKALGTEFRRLYRKHVEVVEGELTLDEEEDLLIEGTLDSFEALYNALSGVEGVRQTDGRVDNLVACSLHLQAMVRAVASSEMLSSYFVEAVSTVSLASRRGYSPKDALAEFDKHLEVVTKKHANKDAYFLKTAERGRGGRDRSGRDIRVDAVTTRAMREAGAERRRALANGEREPRYEAPTMETHALVVQTIADERKRRCRRRRRRVVGAQKAKAVATPKDCTPSRTLGPGGEPLFITQSHLVPPGADNKPLIAEKAAARAVQHRAEKGKKTLAEMRADRRAGGLPDNVRPSRAKSRAGQYYVRVSVLVCKGRKARKMMSVVKPGTDGYYASTTVAEEVRDEWIEEGRPENWIAKAKY